MRTRTAPAVPKVGQGDVGTMLLEKFVRRQLAVH